MKRKREWRVALAWKRQQLLCVTVAIKRPNRSGTLPRLISKIDMPHPSSSKRIPSPSNHGPFLSSVVAADQAATDTPPCHCYPIAWSSLTLTVATLVIDPSRTSCALRWTLLPVSRSLDAEGFNLNALGNSSAGWRPGFSMYGQNRMLPFFLL